METLDLTAVDKFRVFAPPAGWRTFSIFLTTTMGFGPEGGHEASTERVVPLQSSELNLEGLVELYYTSLYRFAFSLTGNEMDACDLTQETFLIWAKKGGQLQDPKKVKSWLFTTLYREHLQQQRRSKRLPHLDLVQVENELPPVDPVEEWDGPALRQALAKIDGSLRATVALFYLEDYSYREIAQILEIPIGTVKSRLSRGIAQLQRLLTEAPPESKRSVET